VQARDRLTIQTNCPGTLSWRLDETAWRSVTMAPAGGVMAGARRHHVTLGPFPSEARVLHFRFECTHPGCDHQGACGSPTEHVVEIEASIAS
jgi:hypothetical protein